MPKQAKLGFQVITSGEGELQVSTQEDLAKRRADKEYESWLKSKKRKLRNWHRHKDDYNRKRRRSRATVEGRYASAERTARDSGQVWEFTMDDWMQVWVDAGWIMIPGSASRQRPEGKVVPAFYLRGPSSLRNTSMRRIDTDKPWNKANTEIMFRGEALRQGKWWRPSP